MAVTKERTTNFTVETESGVRSDAFNTKKEASTWKKAFKKANPEVKARVITTAVTIFNRTPEFK